MEYLWDVHPRQRKIDGARGVTKVDGAIDLYYYAATGEYLRPVPNEPFNYEVMFSPKPSGSAPMVGHREDMLLKDDVSTPEVGTFDPSWMNFSLVDEVNKRTKELNDHLSKQILYGYDPANKGLNGWFGRASLDLIDELKKPSPILSVFGTKEKREMEIGGDQCHLCGTSLLQHNRDVVYKKRQHVVNVKRYECGTVVETEYKTDGASFEKTGQKQRVILGENCVEIR